MTAGDWGEVQAIYLEGIATGQATFETSTPAWEPWDAAHLPCARLVAREAGGLVGWAALSPVSQRCVYGGVAEVSVYVAQASRGRKIGRRLLEALIDESERNRIWTLQAGIFPENSASLAIHRSCGFREVGYRERIGRLNGACAIQFCSNVAARLSESNEHDEERLPARSPLQRTRGSNTITSD